VIGKIVLTMLVAAAKINQSSIVPAFDQTGVPRIIQVPSGAANYAYHFRSVPGAVRAQRQARAAFRPEVVAANHRTKGRRKEPGNEDAIALGLGVLCHWRLSSSSGYS